MLPVPTAIEKTRAVTSSSSTCYIIKLDNNLGQYNATKAGEKTGRVCLPNAADGLANMVASKVSSPGASACWRHVYAVNCRDRATLVGTNMIPTYYTGS